MIKNVIFFFNSFIEIFIINLNYRQLIAYIAILGENKLLRLLLSFAVGGLLGDVFLHLLPEAWNHIEYRKLLLIDILLMLFMFISF